MDERGFAAPWVRLHIAAFGDIRPQTDRAPSLDNAQHSELWPEGEEQLLEGANALMGAMRH